MTGTYALVFDNTFSKSIAKTVLFSLRIHPVAASVSSTSLQSSLSSAAFDSQASTVASSSSSSGTNGSKVNDGMPNSIKNFSYPAKSNSQHSANPASSPGLQAISTQTQSTKQLDINNDKINTISKSTRHSPGEDLGISHSHSLGHGYSRNHSHGHGHSHNNHGSRNHSPGALEALAIASGPQIQSTRPVSMLLPSAASSSGSLSEKNLLPRGRSVSPSRRPGASVRKSSVTIVTQPLEKRDLKAPPSMSDGRNLWGTLLKKKRKKLQGYARRFFLLDYKYGTLNYYLSDKSAVLRGSMPIKLCVITAMPRSLEIFVDSGMEVWNLKALTQADFKTWTSALDVVRLSSANSSDASASKSSQNLLKTALISSSTTPSTTEQTSSPLPPATLGPAHHPALESNFGITDSHLESLSQIIQTLNSASIKAREAADQQEKSISFQPSLPQRRSSFWRRRGSKQTQEESSQSTISSSAIQPSESGQTLSPYSINGAISPNNQSSTNLSTTGTLPPLPKSPILDGDHSNGVSLDELAKLDLKSISPPPVAGPNSVINTLRDLSLTIDKVTEDLKALWNDQSNIASAASAAAAAAAIAFREAAQSFPSNSAAVLAISPGTSRAATPILSPNATSIHPGIVRRVSDGNISLYSTDEFFDAQEFGQTNDGVIYIDKEENSSSSEEEVGMLENDEDDSLSSDDEGDLSVTTHLPAVMNEIAEVENVDGEPYLYPLNEITKPPTRRHVIPLSVASPPSLISLVRKSVGKDLSMIAMPVTSNEPVTILQRMCEIFEYSELVDKAFTYPEGSPERLLAIAAFANSYLSSGRAKERSARKPFNPLLGETYEMVRPEKGIRVITEKVSHRPPIMAIQAESSNWIMHYSPNPHQQFWGKSAEINNRGTARLTHLPSREVFEWEQPTTFLRNVIAGEKYVEPVGSLVVVSSTGCKVVVEYKSGSMFSGRSEDLRAVIYNSNGAPIKGYALEGKWTQSLDMLTPSGGRSKVWEVGKLVDNHTKRFGFTDFAASLNEVTSVENKKMAPTDSRLRPDQRIYEECGIDKAEELKLHLEEMQRQRRKQMEDANETYVPKFFELDKNESVWKLKTGEENYWRRRRAGNWEPNNLVELFK